MMRNKILYKLHLLLLLSFFLQAHLLAQEDLREDRIFLYEQLMDFQVWMDKYHFSDLVKVERLEVHAKSVVLSLKSRFKKGNVDSLALFWPAFKQEFERATGEQPEEKLFKAFAFQMEIPLKAAKIHIKSHHDRFFDLKIYYNQGLIRIEEQGMSYMVTGNLDIDIEDLKIMYRERKDTITEATIGNVRRAVSHYLYDYYRQKGTPVLYKAKVDTTRTYFNEFTYDITNISHEILDAGYFEYIRINIKITQNRRHVEIAYDFQGKYGSGIFTAPRKSQYKNMEIYYPAQLKDYEENLIKKIANYLKY